jgi:hypothetical protein
LKIERGGLSSSSTIAAITDGNNERELYSLRLQLGDTVNELVNVKSENTDLKQRLSSVELDSSRRIQQLIVKCQETERALTEAQRKEEFEESMCKEMALLKNESLNASYGNATLSPPRALLVNESFTNDENTDPNTMDVSVLVNQISELKRSIDDERLYHQEVKAEHEELLALLARQNVENESLQSTIVELAGEEELHKAIIAAEAEVTRKFGVL